MSGQRLTGLDHPNIVCLSPQRPQVRLLSSFSLDRPKNILYHSNDPDSAIIVVDFGMQVPIHFPPFAHLFIEKNSPTLPKNNSPPSPALLALSPQSHKNTSHGKPVDILSTGMIASTRIHKLIALSVRRPPFQNRARESVLESLF